MELFVKYVDEYSTDDWLSTARQLLDLLERYPSGITKCILESHLQLAIDNECPKFTEYHVKSITSTPTKFMILQHKSEESTIEMFLPLKYTKHVQTLTNVSNAQS